MRRKISHVNLQLEFKPQDMWVGVFWRTEETDWRPSHIVRAIDIWLCIVPCLPLHLRVAWQVFGQQVERRG